MTESLPVDRLVVCHGDACAPNTLIDAYGRCCGEWEHEVFDAYGVDPDPERVEHYRRLWNAGDSSSH